MNRVAMIRWQWRIAGPLVTAYSQPMAQASGLIEPRERSVVNLQTRSDPESLEPAFLITSVKGVFRSAGAWLVERAARLELGLEQYVTCDYGQAVPEKWAKLSRRSQMALCPACQLFGGAGCLSAGQADAPHLRLKSPISLSFGDGSDAFHSEVEQHGPYRFAWEQASGRGKALKIEHLLQPDSRVELVARVEGAGDPALVVLLLATDLIGSGFFRFGRFTTRGFGTVSLQPRAYLVQELAELLGGSGGGWTSLQDTASGWQAAQQLLNADPQEILRRYVAQFA